MTQTRTVSQLVPLLGLRWRMIRSPPRRWAVATSLIMGAVLFVFGLAWMSQVVRGLELPVDVSTQALLVYPVALLLFTVVAIVAPFLAGGAIELFPPSQLVAYPITPRTRFAASLALMPFNITWLLQVVLLSLLVVIGGAGPGRTTTLASVTIFFVVTATITGQALAWVGTAVRQTRLGRRVTNALAAGLLVLAVLNVNQDTLFTVADRSPLLPLLGSGLAPVGPRFFLTLGLLAALALVARSVGVLAVGWTLRLGTETTGLSEGVPHRRRRPLHSSAGALRRALLTSVWRSKPIRRGLLLLVVMPIAVAAFADLQWSEVVALPGLVAAGAALLFGVNGFSLLSGGTAWLASKPIPPGIVLRELGLCLVFVIGAATMVTTAGVAAFATGVPTGAQTTALVVASVTGVAWVASTALRLSVTRPYQADLRGNRDAPAPPGAMASYSVRLAGTVGLFGLALVATAQLDRPGLALMIGTVGTTAAAVRLGTVARRWRSPDVQSKVLQSVAFG